MTGGAEGKTPACSKVKRMGRGTNDGEHRGKTSTAKPFLERPQSIFCPPRADQDQPVRIKAKTAEAGTKRKPGLAERHLFFDPKDRFGLARRKPSQQCSRKPGQSPAGPGFVDANLMQCRNRQATAELAVQSLDAEGDSGSIPIFGESHWPIFNSSDFTP